MLITPFFFSQKAGKFAVRMYKKNIPQPHYFGKKSSVLGTTEITCTLLSGLQTGEVSLDIGRPGLQFASENECGGVMCMEDSKISI